MVNDIKSRSHCLVFSGLTLSFVNPAIYCLHRLYIGHSLICICDQLYRLSNSLWRVFERFWKIVSDKRVEAKRR